MLPRIRADACDRIGDVVQQARHAALRLRIDFGDDERADHEDDQAGDVHAPPPDQVADAPHKGHADGVGQQVARHDPGRVVDDALNRQFQLDDDFRQEGRNNGQIERADEDRDADQRQNQPGTVAS